MWTHIAYCGPICQGQISHRRTRTNTDGESRGQRANCRRSEVRGQRSENKEHGTRHDPQITQIGADWGTEPQRQISHRPTRTHTDGGRIEQGAKGEVPEVGGQRSGVGGRGTVGSKQSGVSRELRGKELRAPSHHRGTEDTEERAGWLNSCSCLATQQLSSCFRLAAAFHQGF